MIEIILSSFESILSALEKSRGGNALALVTISFALYAVLSNLAWRNQNAPAAGSVGQLRAFTERPFLQGFYEVLRLTYYVGLPFAALYLGWIDLRSIGLGLLDWSEGVRWAIVILLAAWLLMMVIWLPYLHATMNIPGPSSAPRPFARRLVELIYMHAHWAFYRAAAIVFLTGVIPDAIYWGAVLGLALVCGEAISSPAVRRQLTRPGEADGVVWAGGQAVINTLSFIVTRNFYLLVLIQLILELTVPHLRAAPHVTQRRSL